MKRHAEGRSRKSLERRDCRPCGAGRLMDVVLAGAVWRSPPARLTFLGSEETRIDQGRATQNAPGKPDSNGVPGDRGDGSSGGGGGRGRRSWAGWDSYTRSECPEMGDRGGRGDLAERRRDAGGIIAGGLPDKLVAQKAVLDGQGAAETPVGIRHFLDYAELDGIEGRKALKVLNEERDLPGRTMQSVRR